MIKLPPALAVGMATAACLLVLGACTSSDGTSLGAGSLSANAPSGATSAAASPSGAAPTSVATAPSGRRSSAGPVAAPTNTAAPFPTPGREPSLLPNQQSVLASLPGSSSPSCAEVGSNSNLRSGSVAVGNFVSARKQYRSTVDTTEVPELSMYVIPLHAAHLRSATVTVDPQGKGATKKVTTRAVQQADASQYFSLQVPIAAPGRYRLSVASGPDRGCFLVSFRR
jgi:hypothetical protein